MSWVRASIEFDKWLIERLGLAPAEEKTDPEGA
ncbi:YbjN domain-containing protein OS=Streptomyces microflavus OX=1919 GN=G3I39_33175 PE=4 SV=1 [Streptomyces microflavus]